MKQLDRDAAAMSSVVTTTLTSRLRLHPKADVVPPMSTDESDAFHADVEKNGITTPLLVTPAGVVLDGRHRLSAARAFGIELVPVFVVDVPEGEQVDFMCRQATLRRHLSIAVRREMAAGLLKENPSRSDRQVATTARLSDKTVADDRDALEATAEIPQLAERQGADGRVRPAFRPRLDPLPYHPAPTNDLPLTDAHAAKFPELAAADLRVQLTQALYAFGKPGAFEADDWADRVPRLRSEDLALIRQHLGYIRRWLDKWDRLLDRPSLALVERSPE